MVDEPLHMVDVMPTLLALAGGQGSEDHPFDGKNIWATLAAGKRTPHDEILINVEAIRGAIRKGDWKLVRMATFPGKTELYNLSADPEETANVADQHPEIVRELNDRLVAYVREMKPSEWIKARRPSWEHRARRFSTPTSTSKMAGSPTRSRICPVHDTKYF